MEKKASKLAGRMPSQAYFPSKINLYDSLSESGMNVSTVQFQPFWGIGKEYFLLITSVNTLIILPTPSLVWHWIWNGLCGDMKRFLQS